MQVAEFKLLIDEKTAFKLLDVRTPSEFEGFNFGGVNLPMDDLFSNLNKIESWKTEPFVIICGTGLLSNIAVKVLKSKGFQFAENLNEGIEGFLSV
jgi:rhodanese-related sulfurtransferase